MVSAPGVWNQIDWLRMISKRNVNVNDWITPLEAATNPQSTKNILAFKTNLVTQHLNNEVIIHDINFDNITKKLTTITDPIVALSSDFLFCRSADAIKVIDLEDPTNITFEKLLNPNNNINNEFGLSANITGSARSAYAIIGAPGTDNNKGAVHIWMCVKSIWTYLGKIQPTSLKEGTRFGTSVAIIKTNNTNNISEVSVAVSGMNNVYVFNNINKFFTTTP